VSEVLNQDNRDLIPEKQTLTPSEIVRELDRHVISQTEAKRAVAIALRNRWRRLRVPGSMRDEITPKNIIMIGPTGVGKTEISRRLAKLAKAPFVKVEASKFTEIGYVGRDVDSIIRDLVEASYKMVKREEGEKVSTKAEHQAEEGLLDLLLPGSRPDQVQDASLSESSQDKDVVYLQDESGVSHPQAAESEGAKATREKLRGLLKAGKLEKRVVEVEITKPVHTQMQILGPQGFSEIEGQIKDMFSSMVPKQRERRKMEVAEARKILVEEARESLIDHEQVSELAIKRAEQTGIVFIDEIDKICGAGSASSGRGPDVSREGVQRDLLPLVEGSTISTKYGPVKTDHILFIASGAFHISKPSDLMPEFQGRFPIRVELKSLSAEDFVRILVEPDNALTRQYAELLKTEGIELIFKDDAIQEIAKLTTEVNARTENIGARRLHTLMEKLLEDLSFNAEAQRGKTVEIDQRFVQEKLKDLVRDMDLSRFML
jgi:ATP-dependent HslUV protease ATP-binding subunit HslU